MTGRTLFTATEGGDQLRIELHNRSHLPFTLTCSTRHNGSPAWLELPRATPALAVPNWPLPASLAAESTGTQYLRNQQ